MILRRLLFVAAVPLLAAWPVRPQSAHPALAYTVSFPHPEAHFLHVTMRAEGLKGELQDFKLPAWSPGYYHILDYAKFIQHFGAEDAAGHALPWERTTKNTWRVVAGNSPVIVLSYDVAATSPFGVQNFVNETRAYLSPAGVYMHPAAILGQPVTATFQLPSGWQRIASGLDPVPGRTNTFTASDYDVLYDCPTLIGNQETIEFAVSGRPHAVVLENIAPAVSRPKMLADLKLMVEAATRLIGDIPYRHYTFLMMGTGNGGIEHLNSASISFNGKSLESPEGYLRWLSYVAHEYFHNFNVKRIRPIALGPFDYDAENLTSMLWVSEGLSVYYQDLLLVRSGLMTRDQYLEKMQGAIAKFENAAGHHYQSATDSSLDTWSTNNAMTGDRNATISYYDNGAMLGAMLDLKIRTLSENRKSLDDVMRALYQRFYQQKKRGFTDAEFRHECEAAAGGDLSEVFDYAATTKDVDYTRYFALAGLTLDIKSEDAPGAWIGLDTQKRGTQLFVVSAAPGSPAESAGLRPGDEITSVVGNVQAIATVLAAGKPGDTLKLKISRGGAAQEVEVALAKNFKRSYRFQLRADASTLQADILKSWLRNESGRP